MKWGFGSGGKRQRREYYRYSCCLSMEARPMDSEEEAWMKEQGMLVVDDELPMHEGIMRNISGGGMMFIGTHRYRTGELVYVRFNFGKNYRQCIRILESSSDASQEPGSGYRSRAEFVGMEWRVREGLIRYIFARERTDRKLELE